MEEIISKAKKQFENSGTTLPVIKTIKSKDQLLALKEIIKGKHGEFYKTCRAEISTYLPELRQQIVLNNKIDVIDDFLCAGHILRNGPLTKLKFHDLSRGLAAGCIRDLPNTWTGLVSLSALENVEQNVENALESHTRTRLTYHTYVKSKHNTTEHFYNNQYAAAVLLCYKLYFDYNRGTMEQLCNVIRQVHITTNKENRNLSRTGQNEEDRMGWKEAYAKNNIVLLDARVKPIEVLRIKDCAPEGLLDTAMDMRVGWKD